MNEYAEVVGTFQVPQLVQRFAGLQVRMEGGGWGGARGHFTSLGCTRGPPFHTCVHTFSHTCPYLSTPSTQSLANVLVVPPEALLTLVDGTLRMDHLQALQYIRLRQAAGGLVLVGCGVQCGGGGGV
jgi:hypothetical protein